MNLWRPLAGRFVYGGQVIGQALIAACRTVKEEQHVHSLHCYFLIGGKFSSKTKEIPIFSFQFGAVVNEILTLNQFYL